MNIEGLEAGELKEVMDKEKLPWRSFADEGGAIAKRWKPVGTPTFYIIDHRGVIRYKWAGAPSHTAMDAALEKVIAEPARKGTIK